MRPTSKIMVGLSVAIVCGLFAYLTPAIRHSQPDFTEQDSRKLLDGITDALCKQSTSRVLAYLAPDATVAGHDVDTIRKYLQRGFAYSHNLEVRCGSPLYQRKGDTVTIETHVIAGEKGPGGQGYSEEYYNQDVTLTLKRRTTSQLGGLFETYDWRIVDVFARGLPHQEMFGN